MIGRCFVCLCSSLIAFNVGRFWKASSEHCPETRHDIAMQHRRNRPEPEASVKKKRERKLIADCGRPFNINEAKLEFKFKDEETYYTLELAIYKYIIQAKIYTIFRIKPICLFRFLDTSLIDVDVQPKYVRVTVKSKIFQMALNDEVKISESSSQRSQITGHLLIVMPKLSAQGDIVLSKTDVKLNGNCIFYSNFESNHYRLPNIM